MTRIPAVPAERAGLVGRLVYRYAKRRFGAVPEPIAVVRWHRKLFWATLLAEGASEKATTVLPANVRDLAVYRTATNVGCAWCVDFGTMLQRHSGLDIDRLTRIDQYPTSPLFTDDERLALGYTDAMTAQPMTVTDAMVERLVERFGRAGTIELTHSIALEDQRARFNHALGLTDQGFTSGEACRVPMPGAAVEQ
ncbi:MAG TPA: carboxymuconolactone decarboxylase family protein, partial [Pseudonocardia sp.]|nr:carboxymuconolactone decarboxylase family protein [Pseudonocardia sp.]